MLTLNTYIIPYLYQYFIRLYQSYKFDQPVCSIRLHAHMQKRNNMQL